jgi:hypothetical protein
MQNTHMQRNNFSLTGNKIKFPRTAVIGVILIVALLAFEIFNFDTTRYALQNLLGDVQFIGLRWAAILAIAFCAIDFAGLVRLFTPEQGADEPKEVWYLMGAWLLGATMNAVMTWWAVSLTLLNHDFGNEVLGREQLLRWVPIFVAVLVWLTRILFIGAFSIAGEHIFDFGGKSKSVPAAKPQVSAAPQPLRATNSRPTNNGRSRTRTNPRPKRAPAPRPAMATQPQQTQPMYAATDDVPNFLEQYEPIPAQPTRVNPRTNNKNNSRVRQRPPVPSVRRVSTGGMQAKGRQ